MPRRPSVTREAMVEGAFQLVRRHGHEALTARALASELGCSTQPIMYQFPSLAELRELVYQRADAFHTQYLLEGSNLLEIGLRYVRFAAQEPPLFRLLFQSGHFDGKSLAELIADPAAESLLQATAREMGTDGNDAAERFEALFAMVHGYASLVANNAMTFDEDAVTRSLRRAGACLLSEGCEP